MKIFLRKSGVFDITLLIVSLFFVNSASSQIAIRGTFTTGSSTNANLTINEPAGVVAGDIMILNIAKYPDNTIPSLSGWTLVAGSAAMGSAFGGSTYGYVFYRIANGSEGSNFTFAIGAPNNFCAGSIVAFSGVDVAGGFLVGGGAGGPFDVAPGSISTTGAAVTSETITSIATNNDNAAVIMFGMSGNAPAQTFSAWSTASPGALAEIYDYTGATYMDVGAAWKLKATAGSTGASSLTLSGSAYAGGILIALKPIPPCIPPSAPTVTTPVKYCQNSTATALTATGTSLLWYTSATSGTGSSTAPTPVTTTVGTTPYYVSQTIGCESQRAEIDVVINALPVSSVPGQTNITCNAASDGTITISATGGTGPYFYSIDNGMSFKPDVTGVNPPYVYGGLAANRAFRIKVKDNNGCISK